MDPTDVCPICGRSFRRSEGHRCLSNEEDVINPFDDNDDSTPFLEKVVKESKSYEESGSKSEKRSDFTASGIEELHENTLEETEDEYESINLNLLENNPLISEGNPVSPPNAKSFMEENQKDAFETNRAIGENFENAFEFLETDTSLYTDESVAVVSQRGNPLDGSPFEPLFMDDSSDSNQRKVNNATSAVASKRHSTSSDAITAKTAPDLRLYRQNIRETTAEVDFGRLNLSSFLESDEHQNASKEASVSSPSGSQTGPSRPDFSGDFRSVSKKLSLKHSPKKTFPCIKCEKILCSKRNYENHMLLHEPKKQHEGASAALSSGSQAGPSRPDLSEYSRTETKKSPLKHSPKESFPCGQRGKIFSSEMSYSDYMLLHEPQNTSEGASVASPSGSQAGPLRPDLSGHSRTVFKKSSLKHSPKKTFPCNQCGRILSSKRNYENHMVFHSKRKPFVCEECERAFATKSYLKIHFRRHTGDRRYQCTVCGKRFFQISHLNSHFRIHTGEKPFVCEECGRTFADQSNYCRHRRRHTK